MSAPLPPAVDEAFSRAAASLEAVRKIKPRNAGEARARAAEQVRLQQALINATRRITGGAPAGRKAASGNGNAQATSWSVIGDAFILMAQRIVALEASQLRDGGVWKEDKLFTPNMIVTYRGTLWLCLQETSTRPGNDCWRLMTKSEGNR